MVTNFQFEKDINNWSTALTRMEKLKRPTIEQQQACAAIQLEFDRVLKETHSASQEPTL